MYITCEQCSTTFRLDEKLLKSTGSKVRCSQCSSIFVAYPPVDEAPAVSAPAAAAFTASTSKAALDQELEGIDLAELDSILENDSASATGVDSGPQAVAETDELVDFNESDLDLDFEAALASDEDIATPEIEEAVETVAEELDLDMAFDLEGEENDPAGSGLDQATNALAMEKGEEPGSTNNVGAMAGDLNDDIDMVLDDFEDALGQPGAGENEALEISDDDFNLDFELDAEPTESLTGADDAGTESIGAGAAETESDDLDLGDLGALLDETESSDAADISEADDIEDLELSLDDGQDLALDEAPVEDVSAPVVADDDLDLGDLDELLEDNDIIEEAEVEDLELSLDDGEAFSFDDAPVEDVPIPTAADDDLDLGDLGDLDALLDDDDSADNAEVEDMELSLDDGTELSIDDSPAPGDSAMPAAVGDDLDLGDLDMLLDADDGGDGGEEAGLEDLELSLDDDDELSLDDGSASEMAVDTDDLGLGDLDALLDADDAGGESAAPASESSLETDGDTLDLSDLNSLLDEDESSVDDGEDLDLSLELEPPAVETTEPKEDLEDLEFELDSEFEDKPVSQTTKPIETEAAEQVLDEELDLSDIEQMLEDDTLVKDSTTSEIDPDIEGGSEKWLEDEENGFGLGGDGEIDLSEIEEAIDAADTEIDGSGLLDEDDGLDLDLDLDLEAAESEELDLELEMERDAESPPSQTAAEEPDELDLSDLDLSIEDEKSSSTTETIDAGDIELEFQIEEDGPLLLEDDALDEASANTTAAALGATTEVADTDGFSLEETMATEPIRDDKPQKPVKAPRKKGTSKSLVFVLILALFGGGGYFGYDYVKKNDIQIPYLSEYINPKPKDPTGAANLSTLEINSKFLENEKSGRLFIVTGKVRNGNKVPCKMVRLRGKLYTKGKVLSKTEHTYAGVMIPDQELASKGLVEIKNQLNAPLAAAATVQVKAGQTAPFMVVFSELPEDLDEFAIELVSATKIQ